MTALDLIKCLRQIRQQRLLLTCAPISELPSNISTWMKKGAQKDIYLQRSPNCLGHTMLLIWQLKNKWVRKAEKKGLATKEKKRF